MPQQPAPAATTSYNPDFPPKYEAEVNENMRNFGEPESQFGGLVFDQTQEMQRGRKKFNWRKCLIIAIPILLALTVAIGAAIIVGRAKNGAVPSTPSPAADALHSVDLTTVSVTITKQITATTLKTTTTSQTKTVTASIPKSIAEAASSYFDEVRSSINSRMSEISQELTAEPSTSSTTQPTSTTLAFDNPVAAAPAQTQSTSSSMSHYVPAICAGYEQDFCPTKRDAVPMLTSAADPTTTKSDTAPSSATATGGGRLGFCGAPGTPCLVG